MLIGAFQVHIRRVTAKLRTGIDHGIAGGAGIKPDVQRIRHFIVVIGIIAHQLAGIEIPPGLNAILLNALSHFLHQLKRVRVQLLGLFVHKQRHRHAPCTLTRDTPVRTVGDHRLNARLAPVWNPLHRTYLFQRLRAQAFLIHADKPLRRGTEDDWRFVAPAVWIAVMQFFNVQQCAFLTQQLNDHVVGLKDVNAIQTRPGARQECAIRANRVSGFNAIFLADHIVIRAVAWRGMYRTGTGIQRYVFAQHHRRVVIQERMLERHQLQCSACGGTQYRPFADARALHHALNQIFRQNQRAAFDLQQLIFKFRM